ncbi:MAG: (d)CMP kinase [Methylophilaceae bacterium]|jgi:CMP/dCMP kinase|nr:(d)CMP kinase [Methylophilaceae bacterium]MDG1453360.1 (d)CMP kinase [Methylophilaceae bacterium]
MNSTLMIPVIAIDGPSASGKGSVAERVANQLGFHYLDSGALYRIVALAAHNKQIAWNDALALGAMVTSLQIAFKNGEVLLNGENVSAAIRNPAMSNGASQVAVHPAVRNALLELQHSFRKAPGLVADGRDMASVVFTDAQLKIFLTANVEERANRRYKQLIQQNIDANYNLILQDLQERDERDKTRSSAPLMQTKEAILLDTDNRNIAQAVDFVLKEYQASLQKFNSQQ